MNQYRRTTEHGSNLTIILHEWGHVGRKGGGGGSRGRGGGEESSKSIFAGVFNVTSNSKRVNKGRDLKFGEKKGWVVVNLNIFDKQIEIK